MTPDLTPPEGCVILGYGLEFDLPIEGFDGWFYSGKHGWKRCYEVTEPSSECLYAAPIGSEIALLNTLPDSGQKGRETGTPRVDSYILKNGGWGANPMELARTLERDLADKDALIGELKSDLQTMLRCGEQGALHPLRRIELFENSALRRAEQGKEVV